VVATAVAASVVVTAAGATAQLVNYGFSLYIDTLDSSRDGGLFAAVGEFATAGAAGAAWLLLARERPVHTATLLLPPLLTFIALDKVLRLHDHIPAYIVWYAPVLAGAFVCLVHVARRRPGATARCVGAGLALLVVAFGLHLVGEHLLALLGADGSGWGRQIKTAVKHGLETEGWLLLLIGLASGAARGGRLGAGRR
jgi:hypothetical protein